MTIKHALLLALAIAAAWLLSLYAVYDITRTKWHGLGVSSGEIGGRCVLVGELCALAENRAAPHPIIWSHSVKASIVELSGEPGQLSLYCR